MERLQEKGWMGGGGEGGRMGVGRGREEMGKGKDDFWRRFFLGHAGWVGDEFLSPSSSPIFRSTLSATDTRR